MPTINTHRWTNCLADANTAFNGLRVRAFLQDVVEPALATLDADVERWANTTEGGAAFAHANAQDLTRATTEAFCLSIHSLFERQLRRWLGGCVVSLAFTPERLRVARRENLEKLDGLLQEVRGIPLHAFHSWPDLKRLELLANACRHGDGTSADRLFDQHPEFWPEWATTSFLLPGQTEPVMPVVQPTFESIVVPRESLRNFVEAIAWFWDDTEYIYLNSLPTGTTDHNVQASMARLCQGWEARPAPLCVRQEDERGRPTTQAT